MKHLLQWMADDRDASRPAPSSNWSRVSRMTAETCGKGFPVARSETRPGQAQRITGHDHDYLYFASPLTGDFDVEGDFSTFGYRDIHLAVGKKVRATIGELGGVMPEHLPTPDSSIQQLERRKAKALSKRVASCWLRPFQTISGIKWVEIA